ncbi:MULTISPECIES: hypothetical protein [Trichocoleus]|uniref:Uncharacterized protein n=1 Tax=Trichocoleus desertorum GB2-A4 TaxID=2933944 RepID=A0ABV0J3E8_9CYAN|nr:hypothetical protein [Trichocoleus sp. FACHB-46]MBD1861631.1 hypothetical protein [Trichocoleus sp. FACHB-46]
MNLVSPINLDFFNFDIPLLRSKESAFAIEDLPGLWRIHWQVGDKTIISTFYTRIDQACLLWGVISIAIFATAQFLPISWSLQAIWWSALTVFGTLGMHLLTEPWSRFEHFKWVLRWWAWLMLGGVVITDLSIFWGWGDMLLQLCPLWLGLNAVGYLGTGWRMRSRAFILVALIHLLGILILPYFAAWQFLLTGVVIGVSALLIAELQWDSNGNCTQEILAD